MAKFDISDFSSATLTTSRGQNLSKLVAFNADCKPVIEISVNMSGKSSSRGRIKSVKTVLCGPSMDLDTNYGGLGERYNSQMSRFFDKMHQIDTVNSITETNGSVRSRAIQLACYLRQEGIGHYDPILISSRGDADQTVVILAALLIGAIVTPLDPELHHKECSSIILELKPKICFCDLRALKQVERIVLETDMKCKLVNFGKSSTSAKNFKDLLNNKVPDNFRVAHIDDPRKQVAFILSTQGTTNKPKLVCLSHHNIFTQTQILLQAMQNPVKFISFYPASWIFQVLLTCVCFEAPITKVLVRNFTERQACKLIHDLVIDHAFMTTPDALKLVDHVSVMDFNLSCLKCVAVGNILTTSKDMIQLTTKLPAVRFMQMYCSTETGIVSCISPNLYEEYAELKGTAGKVAPYCKVKIVGLETREMLPAGHCGELLVGGDGLMLGYYKNMENTKAVMEDCFFFKTGDLARYDDYNWLFFEGRIEDLIKTDGGNISPGKIEDVILTHPFVKNAVVIGNATLLVACVIPKTGTKLDDKKLFNYLNDRLPPELTPKKIVFTENYPLTSIGHIKKDVLRKAHLNLSIVHSESNLDTTSVDRDSVDC